MYDNLTIVQYDRGSLGEFLCLSIYKKYYNVDLYTQRRNDLGWYFMYIDGTLDALMYDYHRTKIESVVLQRNIFGACVYEELKNGNYEEARNITHAMINYRKLYPELNPEGINNIFYDLPDPDFNYNSSSSRIITRIHIYDDIDLKAAYPGAEIINVYCPPEKRWIFKFLYMYKKHQDTRKNNLERFKNSIDEFWNFNWSQNLDYKSGLVNINAYDVFIANENDIFDSSFSSIMMSNFARNNSILQQNGLDYTRDNVSSEELLSIIKNVYSSYL